MMLILALLAFELGQLQVMGISVCLTKEDAVAILMTEKTKGKEAADAMFVASENCANLPLEFTPKRIVFATKTERGVGKVIEVESGAKKVYWITYLTPKSYKET